MHLPPAATLLATLALLLAPTASAQELAAVKVDLEVGDVEAVPIGDTINLDVTLIRTCQNNLYVLPASTATLTLGPEAWMEDATLELPEALCAQGTSQSTPTTLSLRVPEGTTPGIITLTISSHIPDSSLPDFPASHQDQAISFAVEVLQEDGVATETRGDLPLTARQPNEAAPAGAGEGDVGSGGNEGNDAPGPAAWLLFVALLALVARRRP
ncbi:MAG: MYXO-CTERM sorting domain-containing protein [Thermoplasmatota archaeon]